ncbi:methyltransferase family protein [Loktanella sp. R86503]|uniref:methyltransferase family protein n=1 Tax=Loktanella sp. R86503 TaxID=3093847 RepID=UPI0036D7C48F
MKYFDLPPVWLALAAAVVWASRSVVTAGGAALQWAGIALVAAGLALMLAAVITMTRARTTVIPHRQPDALVTQGIFARTRNPIYLGDVLLLTGLCLWWQAPLGLATVPVFTIWITTHFITAEEARLHAAFGTAFTDYTKAVRRWV